LKGTGWECVAGSSGLGLGQFADSFVVITRFQIPKKGRECFSQLKTDKLLKDSLPGLSLISPQLTRALLTTSCSGMIVYRRVNPKIIISKSND
jgi:hypothetical protein